MTNVSGSKKDVIAKESTFSINSQEALNEMV